MAEHAHITSAPTSPPAGRRDLFACLGGFLLVRGTPAVLAQESAPSLAVSPAGSAQPLPALATNPDAELITACAAHVENMNAVNSGGCATDDDDDPCWQAYERTRNLISDAEPLTLAGMLAKARASVAEAQQVHADGMLDDAHGTMGEPWSWQLLKDLLRLFSDGGVA